MKANMDYETLRNSMTVQDAARVLKETNCYGTMDIAKNVILKALDEQMSHSEKPNEWIPISKETPKKQGYYITSTIYNEVFCDYWNGDNFDRTEAVLAWLPKPAPYKPQERDDESCDAIWEKAYKEREGKKMNDSFELTLNNPLTKEDWDKIADVELENTPSITFKTPKGKQVKYIKSDILDKIIAEIEKLNLLGYATVDGRREIASRAVLQIIDKYKAESEE